MVGKVCRFYGWTPDYCLNMPASQFFLMLEQVDKLHGKELANECFVSRASSLTNEAFQTTVDYFDGMGGKKERPKDIEIVKPEVQIPASSDDARYSVMGMFGADRRINRKVLREPIENPHPRRRH